MKLTELILELHTIMLKEGNLEVSDETAGQVIAEASTHSL